MKVLFLHGWRSVPGGVKPTFLKDHGHEVINSRLPDDDFAEAVRIAQAEFDKHQPHEILVLIPEISWIPSFASCEQAAAVGDELEVKIVHIDPERNQIAGSVRALHPESDPWHGAWRLGVGDVLEATVLRWVERADRCGGVGGHLLALRPAALVMLCGQEAGRFRRGDRVPVRVTAIDERHRQVKVELR